MKPNLHKAIPFFMVCSMEKSLDFYLQGLGFELKNKWEPRGSIEWCWLERDGVALMLQEYRADLSPNETPGIGFSLYVICENALQLYREFMQRGLLPDEPFVGNGMWVVTLQDPDGFRLAFESLTETPEGTRYSEWLYSQKPD